MPVTLRGGGQQKSSEVLLGPQGMVYPVQLSGTATGAVVARGPSIPGPVAAGICATVASPMVWEGLSPLPAGTREVIAVGSGHAGRSLLAPALP